MKIQKKIRNYGFITRKKGWDWKSKKKERTSNSEIYEIEDLKSEFEKIFEDYSNRGYTITGIDVRFEKTAVTNDEEFEYEDCDVTHVSCDTNFLEDEF